MTFHDYFKARCTVIDILILYTKKIILLFTMHVEMHCFSKTHFRDLSASKLPGVLMDKNKTKQNLNEYLRHGSGNLRTMVFRN